MSSAPLDLSVGRIDSASPPKPSRAAGDSFQQELQRSRKSNRKPAEEGAHLSRETSEAPVKGAAKPVQPEEPATEADVEQPVDAAEGSDVEAVAPVAVAPHEPNVELLEDSVIELPVLTGTDGDSGEAAEAGEVAVEVADPASADGPGKLIAVGEPVLQDTTKDGSAVVSDPLVGEVAKEKTPESQIADIQPVTEEAPDTSQAAVASQQVASKTTQSQSQRKDTDAAGEKSSASSTQVAGNPAVVQQQASTQFAQLEGVSSETDPAASESIKTESTKIDGLKPAAAEAAAVEQGDLAVQPASNQQQAPSAAARTRFGEALVGRAAAAQEDVSLSPAQRGRFVNRVSRAMEVASNTDGIVRLRLSPKALGALKMQVQVNGQNLSATIEAESHTARNLLLDNLPVLRERLAAQNISIESFDVNVADQDDQQGAANQREQLADQQQDSSGSRPRRDRQESQQQETPAGEQSPVAQDDDPHGLNVTV